MIGELKNAGAVFLIGDGTQLLCMKRDDEKLSLSKKCRLMVEKVISPRFLPWNPTSPSDNQTESFWQLDLRSNAITPMGDLSQFRGARSTFQPSADLQFAFDLPTGSHDLLVCDFAKKSSKILKIKSDEWAAGWWDNQNILLLNQTNDLLLLNVSSERISLLLAGTNVLAFLDQHGVNHQGQRPTAFFNWDGHDYQFYVTDIHRQWLATNSFLLRVDRPDARLTLVAADFKFEWSDHFDDSQRYYVYSGRDGGPVDGVFLRDVQTGSERILVEPKGAKQFTIPNWYGTNVIYVWSNELWSIDFNGAKRVRVFPPPE